MTVYVDEIRNYPTRLKYKQWCHLMCDSNDLSELHNLAQKIGIHRTWFQAHSYPHYDLTPNKRTLAIQYGAIPFDIRTLIQKCVIEPGLQHYRSKMRSMYDGTMQEEL